MEENRYRKFYVDWWNIRKSSVYALAAVIVLGIGAYFAVNWASRNNWFLAVEKTDIPKDAARIVSFEGEVRVTRSATRETLLVTRETWVAEGDTIQTMADGRALVRMIDGSTYQVRPNSTIVVKTSTTLFGGKDVRVSVDDGQLNVRTGEQPQDTNNIVEVADSENRLLSNTDASFNADAASGGGEIRISRGGVETTIGGQTTVINENEFASVDQGKLSTREKLLAPPRPVSPANSAQITAGSGGASVTVTWQDAEGSAAANYHLQISRSPIFASDAILVDRSGMTAREYRLAGLTPGIYYWRIRSTARSGQSTAWNDPVKFSVVRSGSSGSIDASEWKVERMGGYIYLISGRTAPGVTVRSQGRDTNSGPDGSFRLQISTASTVTAVEITDDRGNRTGFVISLRDASVVRRY